MIVAICQARLGSKRLPRKVLLRAAGRTLLDWHLAALMRARTIDRIVLATPDRELLENLPPRIFGFLGSEEDVLARYYFASLSHRADVVVRTTADNPLLDPALIDLAVENFVSYGGAGKCDYVSNCHPGGTRYPAGQSVEVISMAALSKAHAGAREPYDREHVTPYIYRHPEKFKLQKFDSFVDLSAHHWTVDKLEDFKRVEWILERLPPKFTMKDCVRIDARSH